MKHEELQIIDEHGQPKGIRDRSGFLVFFTPVSRYEGQDERYAEELAEGRTLAQFVLHALMGRS
jgi:hypothetical protein